ncbi:hypothetical protein ABES58_33105 [Paenibacillus lautus]|uniref:hypothetical protein n=1 Tax=Paenibacillus lautus TaxID=1401 RepID=UPI003D26D99A
MSFRINKSEQHAKKDPPAYLIGLIGMLLSVVIAIGILSLTDFELYSYSILFVLPLGAIALGMISTSVYTWRIVSRGYKPSRQHYAVSLLMAFITFFLIQYGEYQTTYVTEDHTINHQFKGEPIRNYTDAQENVLTFPNYLAFKLKTGETSFIHRGGEVIEMNSSSGSNWFSWSLSLVGFLLGSTFPGWFSQQGTLHCTACKRAYVTEHKLGELTFERVTELHDVLVQEIQSDNFNAFIDIVNRYDIFKNNEAHDLQETYVINIGVCPNCNHGYVIMRHYSRIDAEGGSFSEDNKKIVLPTTGSFAAQGFRYVKAV